MTCITKINKITAYIMIFQNKYIHVIVSVTYYMADMISLMHFRFSPLSRAEEEKKSLFDSLVIN